MWRLWLLLAVGIAGLLFVATFYKELRLVSFDPGLARTLGFSSSAINMVLMLLVLQCNYMIRVKL